MMVLYCYYCEKQIEENVVFHDEMMNIVCEECIGLTEENPNFHFD